jgi:hypothetical protein
MATRARRSRRQAEGEDGAAGGFASLPHAFLRALFLLLPPDARLHCACVCRAWRAAASERALWHSLDLSPATGGLSSPLLAAP